MNKIKSFLQNILRPDNPIKDVSVIAGGAVIAQGLNVLIMPFLSRIYSPENFGVLAVFSSVMSITTQLTFLNCIFRLK